MQTQSNMKSPILTLIDSLVLSQSDLTPSEDKTYSLKNGFFGTDVEELTLKERVFPSIVFDNGIVDHVCYGVWSDENDKDFYCENDDF